MFCGKPRAQDRYNLFGGKIGAPVSVPGLYDGRNRTFFFLNYEGLIQASPYALTSTVPSGAYAAGNFSASPVPVFDPVTKTQFQGNMISPDRLDPAALKILALLPGAQFAGDAE